MFDPRGYLKSMPNQEIDSDLKQVDKCCKRQNDSKLIFKLDASLDEPLPLDLFKITRRIKCLPLLEPKIVDDKNKKIKNKRRQLKRATRQLLK